MSQDPCGRLQYGIPNNSTEHQGLAKVDYSLSGNQSLFARYFYAVYDNPATARRDVNAWLEGLGF